MALTIEQLYQQYAGRAPDPEGLAYWARDFGATIDPREVEVFKAAVAEARAQGTEPTAQPAPTSAPTLFSTPAPAPTPVTTAPLPENFNSSGTYNAFVDNLKNKDVDPLAAINSLNVDPSLKQATTAIYNQIIQQQKAGTSEYWGTGTLASKEAAAAEMAWRLAEGGAQSLSDIGTRQVEFKGSTEGEDYTTTSNELYSKSTGQPLNYNTNSGGLKLNYDIQTLPDGTVVPVATKRESDWMKFRENVLKPGALFVGSILGGQALAGAFGGTGAGAVTDAGFLAADAAQLAAQGLSESAIAQVLSAPGYASTAAANLAASMAANGLDVGMMTQQLNALGTNTGLMSQTGSSADFLAADALQLQGQLGNNFPAIEQNLIASGVDPLIAADISQQLAFNPGLTQTQLAGNLSTSFGNNIYDVNMAQTYPTSVLPGSGGLLSNVPPASSVSTTTGSNVTTGGATSGLTPSQIANLVKAGVGLVGTTGAVSAVTGGGSNTPMQAPTQGVPTNDPNYYNQLQQYYNAYLPQTPRDVVTPLQQWYNSSYGA